jgi:hypothetical protein
MKKNPEARRPDKLLKEYVFRGGARGKYSRRYAAGNNIVVIEPDLARCFRIPFLLIERCGCLSISPGK